MSQQLNRTITTKHREQARRLKTIWNQKKEELNLTQQKLADQLGWTQATVAQYLNCHIALNVQAILAFCGVLSIPYAAVAGEPLCATVYGGQLVQMIAALSGREFIDVTVNILTPQNTNKEWKAILVDTDMYRPMMKYGQFLLASPLDVMETTQVNVDTVFRLKGEDHWNVAELSTSTADQMFMRNPLTNSIEPFDRVNLAQIFLIAGIYNQQ